MKLSLLPVLLVTCPLAGQAVSVTVSAATVVTTRASAAGANDVQALPVGPLSASGSLFAQVVSLPTSQAASMSLQWQTTAPSQYERLTFGCSFLGLVSSAAGLSTAGVDPFELLLQLQAPAPRWVFVAGHVDVATPPGQLAPQLEFDLFDDGTAEWSTTTASLPYQVLVGPTPIPIRVRGAASLSGTASSQGTASLVITPDNRIGIHPMVQGCLADGFLRLEQAFAHDGVRLRVPTGTLCVGVLGLGVQPLLVSMQSGVPCLLLPSPDVLLVIPPTGYDLPIPAAARPIDVYAQAVWFDAQGLSTTTGYRATAH